MRHLLLALETHTPHFACSGPGNPDFISCCSLSPASVEFCAWKACGGDTRAGRECGPHSIPALCYYSWLLVLREGCPPCPLLPLMLPFEPEILTSPPSCVGFPPHTERTAPLLHPPCVSECHLLLVGTQTDSDV